MAEVVAEEQEKCAKLVEKAKLKGSPTSWKKLEQILSKPAHPVTAEEIKKDGCAKHRAAAYTNEHYQESYKHFRARILTMLFEILKLPHPACLDTPERFTLKQSVPLLEQIPQAFNSGEWKT